MELVKEKVENSECISRIIDFYYNTSINVFYGNIKQVVEENNVSSWPASVKKVYYAVVEEKETRYFTFVVAAESLADWNISWKDYFCIKTTFRI